MPELPDVAGFKQYLDATSLHQSIEKTRLLDERIVKDISHHSFQRICKRNQFTQSQRWGKWLFVTFEEKGYVVLHFGMTGNLRYGSSDHHCPKHTRLILYFKNHRQLCIVSRRLIGQVAHTKDIDHFAKNHGLGMDALDDRLNEESFVTLFSARRGAIKTALMNQSIIAGIGNVYADEICFQAKIHPAMNISDMDASTLARVYKAMSRILRLAANKGGDVHALPKRWLIQRRGESSSCPRCQKELSRTTINGRTSWLCSSCQPA